MSWFNKDVAEVEKPRDVKQELVEARAYLAKLRKLPMSAFATHTHKRACFVGGQLQHFTVDDQTDAIARAEAEVAELEVLSAGGPTKAAALTQEAE